MGRPAVMPHNRARYQRGCRCNVCCLAEATYQKRRRHGIAGAVAPIPGGGVVAEQGPGRNERAVRAELDGLGDHGRPGLAEGVITVSRVLDNPVCVAQHPSAARVLARLLDELRKNRGAPARGRLAAVRQMSARSPDAG